MQLASITFSNPSFLSIDSDFFPPTPATPYPATIDVSGVSGSVDKVTVTLNGFSHNRPEDVDMLLVGPGGQSVMLMSDAGSNFPVSGRTITFDDNFGQLPDLSQINSGTYRPTNRDGFDDDDFPSPAPFGGPTDTQLSAYNNVDPNGTWSLYVVDDFFQNAGSISGGWSITINTSAVTTQPPSAPVLDAGSDSGVSNSDGVTMDNTPMFTGTAQAGSLVKIFANGIQVGSGTAVGGSYSITSSVLADGPWSITATATAGGIESSPSAATSITIDTAAPQLMHHEFTFETSQNIIYDFSEDVSPGLALNQLEVQDRTHGGVIATAAMGLSYDGDSNRATISFPGLPNQILPDALYRATLSDSVSDRAGNTLGSIDLLGFFALAGDANHDRAVDISDLAILATNWQGSGKTFSSGDFNYDSIVDISDLAILATNWQQTLSPAPLSLPLTAVRKPVSAARAVDRIFQSAEL